MKSSKTTTLLGITAFVSAILFSSSATASRLDDALHVDNLYVGVGILQTNTDMNKQNTISTNSLSGSASFKNDGFGAQLFAGIKLDEHLAFELGYATLGDITVQDGGSEQKFLSMDTVSLDAILSQSLTANTSLFTKLGIANWNIQYANTGTDTNGNDLHYGLGMDINLYGSDARVMRIEWDHQNYSGLVLNHSDTISTSVIFKF